MPAKLTTQSAISGFRRIHGERYVYEKSVYESPFVRMVITCRLHGDFTQTQNQHQRGANCPICATTSAGRSRNKGFCQWLEKVNKIHSFKYAYQKPVKYRSDCRVDIHCSKHGTFQQLAYDHLRGQGCPFCSEGGFKRLESAYLYMLISNDFRMLKVGITGNIERRMRKLKKTTPFSFTRICQYYGEGSEVFNIERAIHSRFASCGLSDFDGATEWLKANGQIEEIFNVISQSKLIPRVDEM